MTVAGHTHPAPGLAGIESIAGDGANLASIAYSDGDAIEDEIIGILQGASAFGAEARIGEERQATSWPVRYHLSNERANLVRHLRFEGLDVLELGAGFGGVSRHLAEHAHSLTAVEGSARRLHGLRARLRDLDNWQAVGGQIEDVELGRRFDVVCLIGVLEYAEIYSRRPAGYSGDAFDYLLARAASWLAPDGVLLVAIENRIGIKYWTGAGEDHSGRLFEGLAGYPAAAGVKTFSRRELAERLQRRGLGAHRWFFPFPDYKLPVSVLGDELVKLDPRLAANLAAFSPFTVPAQERAFLLPDYLALEGVARAGLMADFANSFLLLASGRADSATLSKLTPRDALAWHYSPARRIATVTAIQPDPDGELMVRKRRRDGLPVVPLRLGEEGGVFLWQPLPVDEIATGEYLRLRLLRRLHFGDEHGFVGELNGFLRYVCERFSHGGGLLRGEALDAIFTNATWLPPGNYRLFDLEWAAAEPFPASWLVLRNLLALGGDLPFTGRPTSFATLADLYQKLVVELGFSPQLERDRHLESRFQAVVLEPLASGSRQEGVAHCVSELLGQPLDNVLSPPSPPAQLVRHLREVRGLEAELAARATHAQHQDALIGSLQSALDQRAHDNAALETALDWEASRAAVLTNDFADRFTEISGLRRQVENQHAVLADLRSRGETLAATVEALRRSTSWRVTGPLRGLGRALNWLGSRLPVHSAGRPRRPRSTAQVGAETEDQKGNRAQAGGSEQRARQRSPLAEARPVE